MFGPEEHAVTLWLEEPSQHSAASQVARGAIQVAFRSPELRPERETLTELKRGRQVVSVGNPWQLVVRRRAAAVDQRRVGGQRVTNSLCGGEVVEWIKRKGTLLREAER